MAFQYAAKFICGVSEGEGAPVASGRYSTVVNVHNPHRDDVKFRYKLAVARPGDNGDVFDFKDIGIRPDGAIYFDCKVVRGSFEVGDDPLLDGFFVIEVDRHSLDVVAVYTTNDPEGRGVPAIDVEHVVEREIG